MEKVLLDSYHDIPQDSRQYQLEFIQSNGAILLQDNADNVVVGISEKTSDNILTIIESYHEKKVIFVKIQFDELISYLGKIYGHSEESQISSKKIDLDNATELDKLANDAPTINLVNSICIDAIRCNASDIHIESEKRYARVRYRIDGVLSTVQTINNESFLAVSSRIKIMANLNILEKRQPQDGRISVSVNNENIDFRI